MAEGQAQKGGFLRGVLGAFVELDEQSGKQAPAPTKAIPPIVVAPTATSQPAAHPEMLEALTKVITGRKTAYTSLLEAATKLEAVIPDQATRFKAAFVTVSGDGQRSLETINQAIEVHLRDLSGELIRFKGASEQQLTVKVGALRSKVASLSTSAASAQQRIEQLRAEIANLEQQSAAATTEAARLQQEADQAEAEVKSVVQAFEATVETVKADLVERKATLAALLV
jgi:chromosome segregation ATPase